MTDDDWLDEPSRSGRAERAGRAEPTDRAGRGPDERLEHADTRHAQSPSGDDHDPLEERAIPTRLGRFQIVGRLGQGAMGTVLEGYDVTLDRRVAIKLLNAGSGSHHYKRLLREAQALARLSHPNVVGVYDAGEDAGRFYIAMERVEGQTLWDWQKTPRPWSDCLRVYLEAGRGLAAVHAEGIVHRDFKPANCIIDAQGRAKVLDFGLARGVDDDDEARLRKTRASTDAGMIVRARAGTEPSPSATPRASEPARSPARSPDAAAALETVDVPQPPELDAAMDRPAAAPSGSMLGALSQQLTRTGTMLGTPAYMAPEQAAGEPTDARADQFSYCVALYEALHGERPFPGNPGLALTAGHQPTFTGKTPAGLPKVPMWLQAVLRRGLSAKREDRYPSMDALLAVLERTQRRRRWLTVGGLSALVVAGLGATAMLRDRPCEGLRDAAMATWGEAQRATVERAVRATTSEHAAEAWAATAAGLDDYAAAWSEARAQACEATRVEHVAGEDLLELRMACLDRRAMRVAATVELLAEADDHRVAHAAQMVRSLPPPSPCLDAETLRAAPTLPARLAAPAEAIRAQLARSWAFDAAGQAQRGLPAAEEAVRAAEALGPEATPLVAEARYDRGRLYRAARRLSDAREDLQAVLLQAEQSGDASLALSALRELLTVAQDQGDQSAFAAWMTVARGKLQRLPDEPRHQAQLSALEGLWALRDGDPERAVERLSEAVEQFRSLGSGALLDTGRALLQLGVAQGELRRDDEALRTFDEAEALARREGLLPLLSDVLQQRGDLHFDRGHPEPAEAQLRASLALRVTFDGPTAPVTIPPRVALAMLLRQRGELDAATTMVELARQSLGPEVPARSQAQVMSLLARVHRQQADWEAALDDYQGVEQALAAVPTPDPVEQAMLHSNVADCLRMMRRFDAARQRYERALEGLRIHAPDDDFRRVYPLYGLGSLLEEQGDRLGARDVYRRALAVHEAAPRDREVGAMLRWKLARSILDEPAGPGPEHDQALALLHAALRQYREYDHAAMVAEIGAFIDECGSRCQPVPGSG